MMVSTHSQYLSEYNAPVIAQMDSGKSPLAMLAKTCETIGLPDASTRRLTKDDKSKDGLGSTTINGNVHHANGDGKKDDHSPAYKKKEGSKSPRHSVHSPAIGKKTPISSEPSTSAAAASLPTNLMMNARNCFPMGFSPLAAAGFSTFPYPSMMPGFPAISGFPGAFATNGSPNPFMRCPDLLSCKSCPAAMMARPCVTPGCNSCSMQSTSTTPAEMMMAFPQSFFAAYSPLMSAALPPTSSSAAQIAYQNLMAAASGQTTKHVCNWIESSNGVCGKSFSSADELATHMKIVHAPSTNNNNNNNNSHGAISSSSNGSSACRTDLKASSPRTANTPLLNHATSLRYHPYMKPNGMVPSPLSVAPFPTMPGFPSAAALQAMYTQHLMATMPHP